MTNEMLAETYYWLESALIKCNENSKTKIGPKEFSMAMGISESELETLLMNWGGVGVTQFLRTLSNSYFKSKWVNLDKEFATKDKMFFTNKSRVELHTFPIDTLSKVSINLPITFGFQNSRFGLTLIALAPKGLCHLSFISESQRATELENLRLKWPGAELNEDLISTHKIADAIGCPPNDVSNKLSIWIPATRFQATIWQLLLQIPCGGLVSYQFLARQLNMQKASRAIGTAVGANPVAFFIPCHRVIGSTGALTGYRWGLIRKQLLLAREQGQFSEMEDTPNLFS